MVNEDIITALKNGIERGESMQEITQVLISSGYNPGEVEEASNFISKGGISLQQIKPEEHLAMPEQKKIFKAPISQQQEQAIQKIKPVSKPQIQKQAVKEASEKESYLKEIILIIILLILSGILILTIVFKDKILGWFSG